MDDQNHSQESKRAEKTGRGRQTEVADGSKLEPSQEEEQRRPRSKILSAAKKLGGDISEATRRSSLMKTIRKGDTTKSGAGTAESRNSAQQNTREKYRNIAQAGKGSQTEQDTPGKEKGLVTARLQARTPEGKKTVQEQPAKGILESIGALESPFAKTGTETKSVKQHEEAEEETGNTKYVDEVSEREELDSRDTNESSVADKPTPSSSDTARDIAARVVTPMGITARIQSALQKSHSPPDKIARPKSALDDIFYPETDTSSYGESPLIASAETDFHLPYGVETEVYPVNVSMLSPLTNAGETPRTSDESGETSKDSETKS